MNLIYHEGLLGQMFHSAAGETSALTLEDCYLALADVPAAWKQQKSQTADKSISTDPHLLHDVQVQTTDRSDAAVQATTGPHAAAATSRINTSALADFLSRVSPMMLAELSATTADAVRSARVNRRKSSNQEAAECLFTLNAFADGSTAAANARVNKHQLQVTSISWSKTGQTLAASYGRYDAEGWHSVPGALATWNLARLGVNSQGSPDRLIHVDNSLMCCSFHPAEPALMAGGTYNGELVIWDLNKQDADAQIAKTDVLSDLRHREPITDISWQFSGQEVRRHGSAPAAYRLFTLGADGRLLVWLWNQLGNPIYGYELQWLSPGREVRLCLGGSCMAFCPPGSAHEEAGLVLVGAEGGRLLRCQVNDINEASLQQFAAKIEAATAGAGNKLAMSTAVKDADYEQLAAMVNAISGCPHHRQVALAAGGDGILHLMDVLRAAPLLVLKPSAGGLLSAAWSPSRPLVFAAGSVDGQVYIYDLAARQRLVQPVAQLQVGLGSSSSSSRQSSGQPQGRGSRASVQGGVLGVNVLKYNTVVPSTLAAAAGDQVKVFRLPPWLVEGRVGEKKLIDRMLNSEDVLGLLKKQAVVAACHNS